MNRVATMKPSLPLPMISKTPSAARRRLWLILCLLGLLAFDAGAQLQLRVSVKVILDGNDQRPPGNLSTNEGILKSITNANNELAGYGRGYQMNLIEIRDLPGHKELYDLDECDAKDRIKAAIKTNAASYLWVPDAMNIYLNNGPPHHGCSGGFAEPIVEGCTGSIGLHEAGHFFRLCHTQGCGCQWCPDCPSLGDDGIDDTLPDRSCWTTNQIASNAFPNTYPNLTAAQQILVSNTFNNVMSYHGTNGGSLKVLTTGQLDSMTDTANLYVGSNIVSGFTRFVDLTNSCAVPVGSSTCVPGLGIGGPFPTVANAINQANPGDIVLIRVGHYNEPMTIRKAITLRATRGNVLLGKP
jgi:hypothetical protein